MEVVELFNQLESNQPQTVEEIKKTFHENLNLTKESWLVNGLFDYYISTSSTRVVEILVGVREPHDKHLFDKISEALKGSSKLQALTFLGHVVRRHPTWIYKITQHPLMKDILKLLKVETDILCLMSALLVIIVLLPMIPALIGPYLQDIFEIFSRLAAWNTNNPTKLPEEHLLHLQISLFHLFHRLYGMYPCNFLSFLRHEYGQREHLGIFSHTIKPMLERVKMHPLLVTASKDAETANTRWKKMEDHDVIVECAKFALESSETSREEANYQGLASSLRSRGSLEHSAGFDNLSLHQVKGSLSFSGSSFMSPQPPGDPDFFSPSIHFGLSTPPLQESAPTSIPQTPASQNYAVGSSLPHSEGTSPPEAAVEATPETTPVKDVRHITARPLPVNSKAVRALNSFGSSKWPGSSTPTQSQPSSPMKKEQSPFRFPPEGTSAFEQLRRDSNSSSLDLCRDFSMAQRIQSIHLDMMQMNTEAHSGDKLCVHPKTPGQPTSPLRIIPLESSPSSPIPTEPGGKEKNGFRNESSEPISSTQEDQEVLEIVSQGEQLRIDAQPKPTTVVTSSQRQCDSVLQEIHPPHVDEYEECQQENGSPCMSGGLHMPNSRSMLDFARRVHQQRQRFYSQCVPESSGESMVGFSTGSSPGEGSSFPPQDNVRRANSCPEMKKGPGLPMSEANISKTLDEAEELEELEAEELQEEVIVNGKVAEESETKRKRLLSASTQTVDLFPLPYEHLFLSVFPPVEANSDVKSSPSSVYQHLEPHCLRSSPYLMLDKYIETAVQGLTKDESKKPKQIGTETEIKILREQVVLLNIQLHFEMQRREVHAERNRRLLGKSRSNRSLEEHNLALRDQLGLLQKDIEQLHNELDKLRKDAKHVEEKLQDTINYWQGQYAAKQKENSVLKTEYQLLEQNSKLQKEKTITVSKELQLAESLLFDTNNEMQQAIAQANIGKQLQEKLEQLQKKLLLMSELQQRYRDRFSQLPLLRCHEEDISLLQTSYVEQVQGLQEMMESRNSSLEALKARIAELELSVSRKDMVIADQKRTLKLAKEEYHVQLEAVESKYQAQRAINNKLEEYMLDLYRQLENKRKNTRSPDISVGSGGSAERHLGPASISPHNSPLSQSLGSPGSLSVSGILGRDCMEMKNLQVIVDQPEQLMETGVGSPQSPTSAPGEDEG